MKGVSVGRRLQGCGHCKTRMRGMSQEMLAIQPRKTEELIEWSPEIGKLYRNGFYVVVARGRNSVLEE